MLPVFLHFQYDKRLVCDNCNKHDEGMLVLMKYAFCKECAKTYTYLSGRPKCTFRKI